MKKQIKAEIIADSLCPRGHRLTTFVLTFPRFILAELNTHRLFSKNSASSRAIPFEKMVKMVEEDPFIPIAWQKDHKGMQGIEYTIDEMEIKLATNLWLDTCKSSIVQAKELNGGNFKGDFSTMKNPLNVTKQICNRLLEPFMWHTVILTASEFDNFFALRNSKYELWSGDKMTPYNSRKEVIANYDKHSGGEFSKYSDLDWLKMNKGQSEIHMMQLAECMWDARNESIPISLKEGEWHIPFGDSINFTTLANLSTKENPINVCNFEVEGILPSRIKIATARCARVSYLNFEGKDDYESDIKLYDTLLTSGHYSPFEHCAKVMSDMEYVSYTQTVHHKPGTPLTDISCGVREGQIINDFVMERQENYGWCRNFRGFIQLRAIIEE